MTFTQFTLSGPNVRGAVRAGTDAMPADNVFHFVLNPSEPVSIAIVDNGSNDASLFLAKALAIGTTPTFQIDSTSASRATPTTFDKRTVVVLNDTMFPPAGGRRRAEEVRRARRRTADRRRRAHDVAAPAKPSCSRESSARRSNRMSGRSGSLGFLDYSHPVFEVFKAPRSGDFSAAHMFEYRTVEPAATDRVIARYDDGAVAAVERKVGAGRVIVWTSTLDDTWTDIAVKPIFLPLVQQLARYLAHYEQPQSWFTVGQVLDLNARGRNKSDRVVVTPSGQRLSHGVSGEGMPTDSGVLELNEQGIYEIRTTGAAAPRPEAFAVNLDPAESDLAPLDPQELVAFVTGHAAAETPEPSACPGDDARGSRAPPEPVVVSADGRTAPSCDRDGHRESSLAQGEIPVICR